MKLTATNYDLYVFITMTPTITAQPGSTPGRLTRGTIR
jgi:hypothetical protein